MTSNLEWLDRFYAGFCNGDWEHHHGCDLTTLDNPGWRLSFDLTGTALADLRFAKISCETPDGYPVGTPWLRMKEDGEEMTRPWLTMEKTGGKVTGACGPLQLDELIGVFRSWVESAGHDDA